MLNFPSQPRPACPSDDWRSGGLTASVLATLEDFLQVGGLLARWNLLDTGMVVPPQLLPLSASSSAE